MCIFGQYELTNVNVELAIVMLVRVYLAKVNRSKYDVSLILIIYCIVDSFHTEGKDKSMLIKCEILATNFIEASSFTSNWY